MLTATLLVPGAPAQKKVSAILARLYQEDQADQERSELSVAEFGRRQRERRDQVFEFVRAGRLEKPVDYYRASMFFQHGRGVDDFLLAHILATAAAFAGNSDGFFMSAAALDRFLMFTGQPQRFGSQTSDAEGKELGDTSKLLSEAIVQVFRRRPRYPRSGLEGRPLDKKLRSKRKLAAAQKELRKLSRRLVRTKNKLPLVERAQELAGKGLLDEAEGFYHAATVLLHGEGPDQLLLAHVLATAAGLLEHKQAAKLYTRTLDRYMDALGRPRVFDPEKQEKPLPAALRLHPKVRARFLGKGSKRRRR